jgi:hypothetical protein
LNHLFLPQHVETSIILWIQGSEELIPEKGIEAEVEARMFMVFCMESRSPKQTKKGDRPESRRERLHPRMSQGTPEYIEAKVGNQTSQGHMVKEQERNHQGSKSNYFEGMQNEQADGVGCLVPMVKTMEESEDPRDVDETVKHIHPEIHEEEHDKAVDQSPQYAARLQNDEIVPPEPPSTEGNTGIHQNAYDGGNYFNGTQCLPVVEDPAGFVDPPQHPTDTDGSQEDHHVRCQEKDGSPNDGSVFQLIEHGYSSLEDRAGTYSAVNRAWGSRAKKPSSRNKINQEKGQVQNEEKEDGNEVHFQNAERVPVGKESEQRDSMGLVGEKSIVPSGPAVHEKSEDQIELGPKKHTNHGDRVGTKAHSEDHEENADDNS